MESLSAAEREFVGNPKNKPVIPVIRLCLGRILKICIHKSKNNIILKNRDISDNEDEEEIHEGEKQMSDSKIL